MRGLVVPERTQDFTADPVELFFDLAFVFAFSQLVSHLVHHPTWSGAAEAGLLFLILWLAWSTFTWAANAVQGNAREVRAVFLVATAASVPIGASVTFAFDSGGGTFAIGTSVIVAMGIGLQLWAFAGSDDASDQFQTVLRYGLPNVAAMALLIVGAFLDGGQRKFFWVLFIVVILVGMVGARSGDWIVRPGHFAERHGLIVIIALGEIVVAIGIAVVNSLTDAEGLSNETFVALSVAGAMAGLMWWGYFDRVLPSMEYRGEQLEGRARSRFVADVYTGFHIPIVAGIIATAAAAEEILLHPTDEVHAEFLVMFVAGLSLFFGGIAACAMRAYRAIAKERVGAIVVLAAVVYLGRSWDGVMLLVVVDVVLFLTLVAEHFRVESPRAAD
jgi:low temperature requirement protein LtrA